MFNEDCECVKCHAISVWWSLFSVAKNRTIEATINTDLLKLDNRRLEKQCLV